jgi:hypothetical protein
MGANTFYTYQRGRELETTFKWACEAELERLKRQHVSATEEGLGTLVTKERAIPVDDRMRPVTEQHARIIASNHLKIHANGIADPALAIPVGVRGARPDLDRISGWLFFGWARN